MDRKKYMIWKVKKAFSHGWKAIVKKLKGTRENKFIWSTARVNIMVRNGRRICKTALEGNRVVWYT